MFDLTKQERIVAIFLIFGILLGLGASVYKRSHSAVDVEIKNFKLGEMSFTNLDELIDETRAININEAGIEELMRLKGVGRVLASRIIDYRREKGHYASMDELKNVKGVGEKLFQGIREDISIE